MNIEKSDINGAPQLAWAKVCEYQRVRNFLQPEASLAPLKDSQCRRKELTRNIILGSLSLSMPVLGNHFYFLSLWYLFVRKITNQTYNETSFIQKHLRKKAQSIYYTTRRERRNNTSNLGNSDPHSWSELNFHVVKMWILTTNAKSMFISAAHEKLRREKKSEFLCKDFNFLTFQTFPNSRHRYQEVRIPFQRFQLSCSQGPLTSPSSTL